VDRVERPQFAWKQPTGAAEDAIADADQLELSKKRRLGVGSTRAANVLERLRSTMRKRRGRSA
jgi:hypothetical protein